jgi:hypothetical protein
VSSNALKRWQSERKQALDEIQGAHRSVGGAGRGRRYATLQLNHAYAMLLSSQFQGYCRDLHSEAAAHFARQVPRSGLAQVVLAGLTQGRKLDQGNPNPGNLGADFARLGVELWPELRKLDRRTAVRQQSLETLCSWRNAIAHQDFSKFGGKSALSLATVRTWRGSLEALARGFDQAVAAHLLALAGSAPW